MSIVDIHLHERTLDWPCLQSPFLLEVDFVVVGFSVLVAMRCECASMPASSQGHSFFFHAFVMSSYGRIISNGHPWTGRNPTHEHINKRAHLLRFTPSSSFSKDVAAIKTTADKRNMEQKHGKNCFGRTRSFRRSIEVSWAEGRKPAWLHYSVQRGWWRACDTLTHSMWCVFALQQYKLLYSSNHTAILMRTCSRSMLDAERANYKLRLSWFYFAVVRQCERIQFHSIYITGRPMSHTIFWRLPREMVEFRVYEAEK